MSSQEKMAIMEHLIVSCPVVDGVMISGYTGDMQITFLGTNGWYDSITGNTLCILITTEEYNLILDAGSGLVKATNFLDQNKQTFIFISHFHLDHIIGLHILSQFRFSYPLMFLTREDSAKTIRSFIARPYTSPLNKLPFKHKIIELPKKQNILPFPVQVLDMIHPDPTIGIRFTLEDKTIAFCPDTGYCANCVDLARNADLLITECALNPGENSQIWPHLNPETAALIAQKAKAKRLILTHFDASRYLTMKDREAAQSAARLIFPETEISVDGGQINLIGSQ